MTVFPRRVLFAGIVLLAALALGLFALTRPWPGTGSSGVALVGGPFTMVNQEGAPVSEQTFRGKPMLVFFGYTYCPDVCPTELQVMAQALDTLGPRAVDVVPVFVSIDPGRDTPSVLKAYVANFGPRFVGLTGSAEQVAAMAKAFRVFYARQDGTSPDTYLMDHTSITYLMGADGKFLKHFAYTTDAKAMADGIAQALGR